MSFLLLAFALPHLLWDKGTETAESLRAAQIPCIAAPTAGAKAWAGAGFCATEVRPEELVKLPVPGVQFGIRGAGTASATTAPWINSNGWRFVREPERKYLYETPRDSALLAASEAFAFGVEAFLRIDPQDLNQLGKLFAFFKSVGEAPGLTPASNVAIIDSGSPLLPEILNLLTRRNLFFRIVRTPDPAADLNVQIGSTEFPASLAKNPPAFADEVRKRLTDRKRVLRIYGSEVVIGRLMVGADGARIYLLNYTSQRVESLRLRVRGSYEVSRVAAFGYDGAAVGDHAIQGGSTEFTLPVMGVCAVIDLKVSK